MKTGIHIKPCNIGEAEKHNRRDKSYLDAVRKSGRNIYIFEDLTRLNQSQIFKWNRDYDYSRGDLIALLQEQIQIYKNKIGRLPMLKDRIRVDKKTGKQKTISGWSPIREGVIPIKADTQISDFAKSIIGYSLKVFIQLESIFITMRGTRMERETASITTTPIL